MSEPSEVEIEAPVVRRSPALTAKDLRGVIVALVTPFAPDGALDERSFVALVEWLLAEGVHGFVLNGTTGESPTVRWGEVERLLARLRVTVRGQVPVLVGTGTYDTAESVERTERAAALGADGAFAVVPYYSRPAPAGVLEHFRRIAAVGLPTVIYNIPYRTGLALDLATLRAALALPGVVGLKESSGGLANVTALAALAGQEAAVLCGEDALFLDALEAGGDGSIVAAANLLPGPLLRVHRAWTGDRPADARRMFAAIRPLLERLFAEPNPAPVKWALAHQGRIASPTLRLPMVPISAALADELAALLAAAPPAAPEDAAVEELARRFAAASIPAEAWTHVAHLTMGAWHVHHLGGEQALPRLRAGIRRLNQAHGTPESPTRGYHETITAAYVRLIDRFLAACPAQAGLGARVAALLRSPLAARDALLAHYSRERLMSPEARAAWLAPDREPL
jgi:4-hydroxy-tetrahydrodipicolinate synthase